MKITKPLALAALLATTVTAACNFPTPGASGNPVGLGTLTSTAAGAAYTTSPSIGFYRLSGAAFLTSVAVIDTCFQAPYSDTPVATPPFQTPVTAGPFIEIRLGSRSDTLRRSTTGNDPEYTLVGSSGIPYTPGDSIVINVAGDPSGFPTSSFSGRTAEPFVLDDVVIPGPGAQLVASWNPPGGVGAAMLVSFQYSTAASSTLDRQIACTFVDDGGNAVPDNEASLWLGATNRRVQAQRVRTIFEEVPIPRSFMNLVTAFTYVPPASP
ncbi:MAG: hypothetical protein O2973_05465 [Gemmatimonadetes bacterium]|nr:hypothetical protein [Gemmatimonadota bacterium]